MAGLALIAAGFVFARRFAARGERGWAACCVLTVVANVVLNSASFATSDYRLMLLGGALTWTWASVVTARLRAELPR